MIELALLPNGVERRSVPRFPGVTKRCPCHKGGLGRLICAMKRAAPEPIELLSSMMALVWAAWLSCAPHLFQTGLTYNAMAGIAPQSIWGAGALAGGLFQFLSLAYWNRKWRRWASGAVALMWLWFSVSLFLGAPGLVAGPLHMLFAVACFWCWRRHWANAREI